MAEAKKPGTQKPHWKARWRSNAACRAETPGHSQSLDRRHLHPVRLDRQHQAGTDRLLVSQHVRTAPLLAPHMGAGEPQSVLQQVRSVSRTSPTRGVR